MSNVEVSTRIGSAAFVAGLVELVTKIAKKPAAEPVTGKTPLFESGLIDSMAILQLIGFIEQRTGAAIPTRLVVMKHFRTIDDIVAAFWVLPKGEGRG